MSVRALVTGGAGFIGSHIVTRLVEGGHDARVLDNFSSGKRDNLAHLATSVDVLEADVRSYDDVARAAEGCDVIFHQAAIVSVPYSVDHPRETHDVNIEGTLNVLCAAREKKARRVVFASSAAIYGEEPTLPKTEAMLPQPISPYGVEKLTGEHYLATFTKLYGLETVALRYFNVFGPRQDPSSAYSGVISVFVDRILGDEKVGIFGDGEQTRDFVYVGNVVSANMLAATSPRASGRLYNVACGEKTSLLELADRIAAAAGKKPVIELLPPRAGDIRHSLADISRARAELGYDPKIWLEEGLKALVDHEISRRSR
jgi:UDP-glucose 4-epimerase